MRESLPVVGIASIFMLLTLVPYIYGYLNSPPDAEFMFVHTLNSGDLPTYLAQIERARNGEILIRNSYTPEKPNHGLFRPEFVLIGNVARLTGISNPAAYHLGRIVFGVAAAMGIYLLASLVFEAPSARRLAVLIAFTSSGVGWLYKARYPGPMNILSADVFQPEAIVFMSVYESPHMAISYALMALLVFFLMRGLMLAGCAGSVGVASLRAAIISAVIGGICGLFLLLSHPFDLIAGASVCAVCVGLAWIRLKFPSGRIIPVAMIVALLCVPAPIYTWVSMRSDITLQKWAEQNVLPSQRPIGYVLCYGFLWIPAAYGCFRCAKRGSWMALLLGAWVMIHWVAIYLPVNFQRRMTEGWHIPIALLATAGLLEINTELARRFRAWAANRNLRLTILVLVLILLAGTNIYHVRRDLYFFATRDYRAYMPKGICEAMEYVRDNTGIDEVIFTDEVLNNHLPAVSGNRVFGGHSIQGVVFEDTWQGLRALPDGRTPEGPRAEAEFLRAKGVTHWLVMKRAWKGPRQLLGLRPEARPYLKKIFENEWASVWKVIPLPAQSPHKAADPIP